MRIKRGPHGMALQEIPQADALAALTKGNDDDNEPDLDHKTRVTERDRIAIAIETGTHATETTRDGQIIETTTEDGPPGITGTTARIVVETPVEIDLPVQGTEIGVTMTMTGDLVESREVAAIGKRTEIELDHLVVQQRQAQRFATEGVVR